MLEKGRGVKMKGGGGVRNPILGKSRRDYCIEIIKIEVLK